MKTLIPDNEYNFKAPSIQAAIEALSDQATKVLAMIQIDPARGDTKHHAHADLCATELALVELNNSLRNRKV